ncbi:zinc metalloprotease [Mucilaginibacter psychrotolerans]|uniref:Uncharacterized protein n=1 Tax=Mucilaginibacter psychrotolerans TaxID=1524096 RepID=A0A4Y8S4V1_9SPHI|nr:hypothetical protein [Mucilaginibacter psychrotolerans]TFF33979.1 hypothetical protein E2R66_23655 [Mucilaginibacter psychrotolerans]
MAITYKPNSHFFADYVKLSDADDSNFLTDGFGPISENGFSTTSKVHAKNIVERTKVYAVCKGRILIQPVDEDPTKVNYILKPADSYGPFKIKFFIYRGLNKADVLNNNILVPKNVTDINQPFFLQKIWDEYIKFNTNDENQNNLPDSFPSFLIGYDPFNQSQANLIDDYFTNSSNDTNSLYYQIPSCEEGDYIGNFIGGMGFDIVLDRGDFKLDRQTESFSLNLKYARKLSHAFVIDSTITNVKQFKENIHQFIDPAAFWGSHIDCGSIKTFVSNAGIKSNSLIFENILKKFQNKNKIYLQVFAERERSYNYFSADRTIEIDHVSTTYNTLGWPILIQNFSSANEYTSNVKIVDIGLEGSTDPNLSELERFAAFYIIAPNNNDLMEKPSWPNLKNLNGTFLSYRMEPVKLSIPVYGKSACASFIIVSCNLKQGLNDQYFDNLWPFNMATYFKIDTIETKANYWITADSNSVKNLSPVIKTAAIVHNKVFFDEGLMEGTTVKRRLFIAIVKSSSSPDADLVKLGIENIVSGVNYRNVDKKQYYKNVFDDSDCSIYRGQITDGSATIQSLSIIHESDFLKKYSFFGVGMIEEEYNKLLFNQAVAPPLTAPTVLPNHADKVFLVLKEEVNSTYVNKSYKKYLVGLNFEDGTGLVSSIFPTNSNGVDNRVFIYSLDGCFFFSAKYSASQIFYEEFAKSRVDFRTLTTDNSDPSIIEYSGEFGFDYLRVGDNNDLKYKDIIQSGYERRTTSDNNTEFESSNEAYKALLATYHAIPTQNSDKQYYMPYLRMFSKNFLDSINQSPFYKETVSIKVLVDINEPLNKLEFEYDKNIFKIDKPILSDKQVTSGNGSQTSSDKFIIITCLKEFNESKQIRILSYPAGKFTRSDASLAGMIMVSKNSLFDRKRLKILYVNITTNPSTRSGHSLTGSLLLADTTNLENGLAQCLVYPEVDTILLPLDLDPKFQRRGIYIDNGQIKAEESTIYSYLKQKINSTYSRHLKVFIFSDAGVKNSGVVLAGKSEGFGKFSVLIFGGKVPFTLIHEIFHSLGLYHSHKDSGLTIDTPDQAFVYPDFTTTSNPQTATDNYMSYNDVVRRQLWEWQIKIVHRYIK